MYRAFNTSAGLPDRIYRSPLSIRREMQSISGRIHEINEQLNLRNLLLEMADRARLDESDPAYWLPELNEALTEAEGAYRELTGLKDELTVLRAELEETLWALRR